MLDFLRKHQGTMWIIITVVVIIAFTFFGGYTNPEGSRQRGPADTAFSIYGNDYTFAEYNRLQRYYELSSYLQLSFGRDAWADLVGGIAQRYRTNERVPVDFAFNLAVLRKELEKNGIRASDEEVKATFKKLPALQKEGKFDVAQGEFLINQLGSLGMVEADLYDLLRDYVGFQKLQQVVSGNYAISNDVSQKFYTSAFQTVKAASIPFALDSFKKSAQVQEDEIKKYFEEKKDTFLTAEKRAVSYVVFAKPDVEKLGDAEKLQARKDYTEKVNNFDLAVKAPGAVLEDEAKKAGVEIKTAPAFDMSSPPEDLKEEFGVVSAIFQNDPKIHAVTDAVEGNKGYYIARVSEIVEPKPQELKDVQDKIKEVLIGQKAQEAMTKAANDVRKKIEDLVKAGKNFDDAAKEAGVTPQTLPEFSQASPLTDLSNGMEIARESRVVPAGGFTKPLTTDTGIMLVYVLSKELRKRENGDTMKDSIHKSVVGMGQMDVFQAWFERRRDEAKVNADPLMQRAMGS